MKNADPDGPGTNSRALNSASHSRSQLRQVTPLDAYVGLGDTFRHVSSMPPPPDTTSGGNTGRSASVQLEKGLAFTKAVMATQTPPESRTPTPLHALSSSPGPVQRHGSGASNSSSLTGNLKRSHSAGNDPGRYGKRARSESYIGGALPEGSPASQARTTRGLSKRHSPIPSDCGSLTTAINNAKAGMSTLEEYASKTIENTQRIDLVHPTGSTGSQGTEATFIPATGSEALHVSAQLVEPGKQSLETDKDANVRLNAMEKTIQLLLEGQEAVLSAVAQLRSSVTHLTDCVSGNRAPGDAVIARKALDAMLYFLFEASAIVLDFNDDEIQKCISSASKSRGLGQFHHFDVGRTGLLGVMRDHLLRYYTTCIDQEDGKTYHTLTNDAPHAQYVKTLERPREFYVGLDKEFNQTDFSTMDPSRLFHFFLPLFQIHLRALWDIIVDVDTLIQKLDHFTCTVEEDRSVVMVPAVSRLYEYGETDGNKKLRTHARELYPDFFTAPGRNDDGDELPSLDTASRELALRFCTKVDAMFQDNVSVEAIYDHDMRVLKEAKGLSSLSLSQLVIGDLKSLPNRIEASFRALETLHLRLINGFKIVRRWLEIVSNTKVFKLLMGVSEAPIRSFLNEIIHQRAESTDAILDAFNNLHKHTSDAKTRESAKDAAQAMTTLFRNLDSRGVPPIPSSSIGASAWNATASSLAQPRDYLEELIQNTGKNVKDCEKLWYYHRMQ